ncbi:MAG: hypothetical protein IJQ21_05960, partial [Lachnospiraceae bacterium]|nr:hypothetical protein [Lachnospiraceae bacterium]
FDGDSSGDYAFGSKGIQVFGGWYENIYAGVTVNIWDQMTGIEFAFSEEDNSLICSCEYDGEKNRLVFDGTDYATDDRATASGYVERIDDGIKVTFTSSSVKWIESGASYTLQQTE